MAPRGSNFSAAEARQLTISFLHISQDPIAGNGQRAQRFWDRIAQHYNGHKGTDCVEVRSAKSLETKWNQIKKETTKFCGAFSSVDALSESGTNFDTKVEKSLALYKGKHPKLEDFAYLDVWFILREIPRWADINVQMKKSTPLTDITNGVNSPTEQSLGGTGPIDSFSTGELSPEEETTIRRPTGSKKAKDAVKRQKLLDESLKTQARATYELTATILEKVALMKEQAMVAVFALKDDDGKMSAEGKEFFHLKRARDLARFKRELEIEANASERQEDQGARRSSFPAGARESASEFDTGSDSDDGRPPVASRTPLFGEESGVLGSERNPVLGE